MGLELEIHLGEVREGGTDGGLVFRFHEEHEEAAGAGTADFAAERPSFECFLVAVVNEAGRDCAGELFFQGPALVHERAEAFEHFMAGAPGEDVLGFVHLISHAGELGVEGGGFGAFNLLGEDFCGGALEPGVEEHQGILERAAVFGARDYRCDGPPVFVGADDVEATERGVDLVLDAAVFAEDIAFDPDGFFGELAAADETAQVRVARVKKAHGEGGGRAEAGAGREIGGDGDIEEVVHAEHAEALTDDGVFNVVEAHDALAFRVVHADTVIEERRAVVDSDEDVFVYGGTENRAAVAQEVFRVVCAPAEKREPEGCASDDHGIPFTAQGCRWESFRCAAWARPLSRRALLMICRVCDSTQLEPVLDLGEQPWCNHFLRAEEVGREPRYPLRLMYCHGCTTTQLDHTVPKETMFGDHTYLSGVTRSLGEHFREVAVEVELGFFSGRERKTVLDIGSNDGTQLKHFRERGWEVLGVESSKTTAAIAEAEGIPTVNAFFNLDLARSLGRRFDVVNAAGVFFHLEELHSVAEGIRESLAPDGVFVVQFLSMKRIVANGAFDQIYHEHLLYYNLRPLETLLSRHGLELFDARMSPIHGGSVIAFAGHPGVRSETPRLVAMRAEEEETGCDRIDTYRAFARRVKAMREANLAYLYGAKAAGKRVFGLGAPVKGNTMLNYFGVGPDLIECLVERNPLRRGLFAPGSHIPVRIEDEFHDEPDVYYVLAWNFKREILARYAAMIERGVEFFFPVDPEGVPS